ncbi:MAG TPA: hypothetical protein VJN67_23860 [Stellaceae bacterium]|nr:hypothetical protein [Stellaceae bacterium]
MTVCVSAICTWAAATETAAQQLMIVGCSDRLLTVGDIEFEPFQSKIYYFSKSVVALVAGDAQAQISICEATRAHFTPSDAPSVEAVANFYAEEFARYRRTQAEYVFLQPLGLDQQSFISRQHELTASLAHDLANSLLERRLDVETIISGVDSTGYHIFTILDPGIVRCSDAIGFAAIGIGQRHAESTFMFQRYARHWSWPRALLLTYAAKKRAEVAPGIGANTDFFWIGVDGYHALHPDIIDEIDAAYSELRTKNDAVAEEAGKRVDESLVRILKRNLEAQAKTQGAQADSTKERAAPKAR